MAITDHDLDRLRTDAGAAGDHNQVALCDLALDGRILGEHLELLTARDLERLGRVSRSEAREACEDVIRDQRAQEQETA